MKERLDILLVKKGLVDSRSKAIQVVKEGLVQVDGEVLKKPSQKLKASADISLKESFLFVGRGAEKLQGAHEDFSLSFKDKVIGDMGASTGGFTEYALIHGAKEVLAVDVGKDQLALRLRNDVRVRNFEGTNIREGLPFEDLIDMLVFDLSFISLTMTVPSVLKNLKSQGEAVLLVKPQFEVGKENLGKNGIVKDSSAVVQALEKTYDVCLDHQLNVKKAAPCRIQGKAGNQEYFFYCVYEDSGESYPRSSLANLVDKSGK